MRNFVPSTQQLLAVPDVNLREEKLIREGTKKNQDFWHHIIRAPNSLLLWPNSFSSVENGSCLSLGIPITNVNLKNSYSFQVFVIFLQKFDEYGNDLYYCRSNHCEKVIPFLVCCKGCCIFYFQTILWHRGRKHGIVLNHCQLGRPLFELVLNIYDSFLLI